MSVPMMPWGRTLLSVAEEATSFDNVPLAVIVAAAAAVVVVVLLALCVCGDRDSKPKLQTVKKHDVEDNQELAVQNTDSVPSATVEAEIRAKSQNGKTTNRNSAGHSRGSQVSTGSSQMRPTSLRELPEPPPQNGQPAAPNTAESRPDDENDDYDHLHGKKNVQARPDNYDHVQLGSSGQTRVLSPSEVDAQPGENYYTQVPERTYEVVKDSGASKSIPPDDPYTKVKDANSDHYSSVKEVKETNDLDPYDTVNDKEPYSKVKGSSDTQNRTPFNPVVENSPYPKVTDTDPYAKVKDNDPYTKVKDNYSYAKVKESIFDPYARISESDRADENVIKEDDSCDLDPYATVDEETPGAKTVHTQLYIPNISDGNVSSPSFELLPTGSMSLDFPHFSDEYAVVMKKRNPSVNTEPSESADADPNELPPEPPRAYNLDEISHDPVDTRHCSGATSINSGHEYTMVTARESLASMTARNALNPYEIVPENEGAENMYATVDGNSGDGVIQNNSSEPSATSPVVSVKQISAQISDTYTEIGGPYNEADAPAPPSLDSLHLMSRQQNENRRHLASPEDSGISRSSSDYAVVNKRSSFSPSATKLPEIPNSPSSKTPENETANSSKVTLDPNYQIVKDCITDMDPEYDPNYESVEEANSRAPVSQKQPRQHHYEQVSPKSGRQTEASVVRDRVLNSHTYEDPAMHDRSENMQSRIHNRHTYEEPTMRNDDKTRSQEQNRHMYEEPAIHNDDKVQGRGQNRHMYEEPAIHNDDKVQGRGQNRHTYEEPAMHDNEMMHGRGQNRHMYEEPAMHDNEMMRGRGQNRHMYEDITEVKEQRQELNTSVVPDRERFLYKRRKSSDDDKNLL